MEVEPVPGTFLVPIRHLRLPEIRECPFRGSAGLHSPLRSVITGQDEAAQDRLGSPGLLLLAFVEVIEELELWGIQLLPALDPLFDLGK